tara:strand:- start:2809 stop:3507 length:699 start_codon:yes stop_codon:yes gene_type:complete
MTTAYVIAGGLGTRLRSVVSDVPKPMAIVDGKPFLEYLLNFWISQGVSKFIISVSYMYNKVIDYFGDNFKGVNLEYFIEEEPMGTGGGLIQIVKNLSETFVVINGDTFFEISLNELKSFKHKTQADLVIALFKTSDKKRYGQVLLNEFNQVNGFYNSETKYSKLSNGGVYLVDPLIFKKTSLKFNTKCSFEKNILPTLIKQGFNIFGFQHSGKFIDIGLPEDYKRASNFLKI